jgi:hypothetical protein
VVLLGSNPDVEKGDQYYLILDFYIRGFFGLGKFFDHHFMDWRLASWRFLQFDTKIHIHSVSSYAPLSGLDKIDETQ